MGNRTGPVVACYDHYIVSTCSSPLGLSALPASNFFFERLPANFCTCTCHIQQLTDQITSKRGLLLG